MINETSTSCLLRKKLEIPTAATVLTLAWTSIFGSEYQYTLQGVPIIQKQKIMVSPPSYTINDDRTLYPASELRNDNEIIISETEMIKNLIYSSKNLIQRLNFLPSSDDEDKVVEAYFSSKQLKSRKILRKS